MNELYFLGIDIIEETKTIMNLTSDSCTEGMSESELKAYQLGITNVFSILESVLQSNDEMIIVNMEGLDVATELSIDDLEEYYLK